MCSPWQTARPVLTLELKRCCEPGSPQQATTSQHSAEPRICHALSTQTRPASRNTTRRTHSKQIAYWLHVTCLACLIGLPPPPTSVNTARSTVRVDDKNDSRMTTRMNTGKTTGMNTRMNTGRTTRMNTRKDTRRNTEEDKNDDKMTAPHITHAAPHIACPKPHPTPPNDRKRTKK